MKVTCSSQKVGEKHDQAIVDLKTEMSRAQELVNEKETQVVMLEKKCAGSEHVCNGHCTVQKKMPLGSYLMLQKSYIQDLPLFLTKLMVNWKEDI